MAVKTQKKTNKGKSENLIRKSARPAWIVFGWFRWKNLRRIDGGKSTDFISRWELQKTAIQNFIKCSDEK